MAGGAVVFTVLYGFTGVKILHRWETPEKSSGVCTKVVGNTDKLSHHVCVVSPDRTLTELNHSGLCGNTPLLTYFD